MTQWYSRNDTPKVEVGDRILVLILEQYSGRLPLRDRIVILEATETGWESPDPVYAGYNYTDGDLWCYESKFTRQVRQMIDPHD